VWKGSTALQIGLRHTWQQKYIAGMSYPNQNRIYPGYKLIETQFRMQLIVGIGAAWDRECRYTD
jgi:hypothetical protein